MSRDALSMVAGAAVGAALLIVARLMVWGLSALAPILYPNLF